MRSEKKKHEITGNSLLMVTHKKNIIIKKIIFLASSTPMAVSYYFFHVFSRRGALCKAATTGATYSWVSVVIMSAIKRYCRQLSIEYSSSPKLGAVGEMSSKEHDASSSLLLKEP